MMNFVIRTIDKINDWIGKIACLLFIPLVLITTYEVFSRYILKKPTIWSWDINIQIFAAIIMLGGGYTLLQKGHVSVDVFTTQMSPKGRAILDILTSVFFFIGVTALTVKGWEMALMSIHTNERMSTIWAPPYYYVKMLIPIGGFLVLLQGISKLLKDITLLLPNPKKD